MVDKCPEEKQSLGVGMRDLWVFTNKVIRNISLKELRKQPYASPGESASVRCKSEAKALKVGMCIVCLDWLMLHPSCKF